MESFSRTPEVQGWMKAAFQASKNKLSKKTQKRFLSYFTPKFIYVKENRTVNGCSGTKAKTGFVRGKREKYYRQSGNSKSYFIFWG